MHTSPPLEIRSSEDLQAPTKTCQMVQIKNDQAVTVTAMTPVIRVGRLVRVDWGMAAASK